jgi:hypothetical protein
MTRDYSRVTRIHPTMSGIASCKLRGCPPNNAAKESFRALFLTHTGGVGTLPLYRTWGDRRSYL